MIILKESSAGGELDKPVVCSKCKRRKLGSVPKKSKAVISRRGKSPPDMTDNGLQVKCAVCGTYWRFTIE